MPRSACLLLLLAMPASAVRPDPPGASVTLPLADPVVLARLGRETLRLRVDLGASDVVTLNPAAADRLALRYGPAPAVVVGTVELPARQAPAVLTVDGRKVPAVLTSAARPCCVGVDGAIAVDLLPYREVRLEREGTAAGERRTLAVEADDSLGLRAPTPTAKGPVDLRLALDQPVTLATFAGGARLAGAAGGALEGAVSRIAGPYGVERNVRLLRLSHPVTLGGFAFSTVPVRLDDYRGSVRFPAPPAADTADIVVEGRPPRGGRVWPAILVGRDRLDRCSAIVFRREPRSLELTCG